MNAGFLSPDKGDVPVAHLRKVVQRHGVVVVEDGAFTELDAGQFIATLGLARTRANNAAGLGHVQQLIKGLVNASSGNALEVKGLTWNLLQSYAETGAPPVKTEQVIAARSPVSRVLP